MSVADRLNKLSTDITNAYTSIENKGGTTPANKNTNNLSTAINSIEVIEQATAEGESLSLVNTKAMPYNDFVVEGKSEQETRSGKNLWNNNNVTSTTIMTPNSNGGFKIQRVGNERISAEYPINIPANTNITISRVLKNYSNSSTIYCQWIATDNTTIWTPNIYADTVTISFNKDIKGIIFYLQQTANDGDYVEIEKLQIETGSTATSYEPYGASPSPEYPSDIHSVADDVNLLENMTIYNSNHYISPLLKLNPGTYTFNYTGDSAPGIYIRKNDGSNPTNGTVVDQKYTANNITFSISETGNYYIHLYSSTIWEQLTMNNPKLQKGTVATPYSPYNQGTVTIKQRGTTENNDYTFQTEPLRSLPNGVKDTIEAEQHRKIEYLVFDGSDDEVWELWSGGTNTIGFKMSNIANLKNIQSSSTENVVLSNYFKKKPNQDRLTGDDEEGFATAVGNLYFKINRTTVNSLAEWKIWLSTHPTEVLYELATEVIEQFTQQQATTYLDIIKTGSYEGTTNIYTDEDVKPTIGVDYYKKS